MDLRGRSARQDSLVVAYCGRGAVVWRSGRVRYAGPRDQRRIELEAAVEALLEMERVDRSSVEQVRESLLTIAGARVLRDPEGFPRRPPA
jgi:hypothetical protein